MDAVGGGGVLVNVGGIEKDPHARESHRLNFANLGGPYVEGDDVRKHQEILEAIGAAFPDGPLETQIDLIVASPPCQLFSRVGRGKLRSLEEAGRAPLRGGDRNLFEDALQLIVALQPMAVALENVKEYLRYKGQNVAEEVRSRLEGWADSARRHGSRREGARYRALYGVLNSVWYGVPQVRERVVVLGLHEALGAHPRFPDPTTDFAIGSSYWTARNQRPQLELLTTHAEVFVKPAPNLPATPGCAEALGDLPVRPGWTDGYFEPERTMAYRGPARTPYQLLMRQWSGFEGAATVENHRTRTLKRDYETFERMRPNDGYQSAHAISEARFQEELARRRADAPDPETEAWDDLRAEYVPPYPLEKFHDKWRMLSPDLPSHTLTAHLAHDCYSHIHYDASQGRTITIREAARLQSFPDGFKFAGGMNAAFRQIGNAVPPLMAKAVGEALVRQLRDAVTPRRS